MSRRPFLYGCVMAAVLGGAQSVAGCMVVVGDGSYSVDSDGGGSSGSSSGGTNCPVNATDSQCIQCTNQSCCSQFTACVGSSDCQSIVSCIASCTTTTCPADCENQYQNALPTFTDLINCLNQSCPVCAQSGVGDPCTTSNSTCTSDLTCNNVWCTKTCSTSADCAGVGPSGGDSTGLPNTCIENASKVNVCFPTCNTATDCAKLPGTGCYLTTSVDDTTVDVCSVPPSDAGTGG